MINLLLTIWLDLDGVFTNVHGSVSDYFSEDLNTYAFQREDTTRARPFKNVKSIYIPKTRRNNIFSNLYKAKSMFFKMNKMNSPFVIHTMAHPLYYSYRLSRKLSHPKDKHVLTLHGVPRSKLSYYTGKIMSKDSDVVTSVSKFTADLAKDCYKIDSIVVPNGVNTSIFKPKTKSVPNKRKKILYVGRLIKSKHPDWVAKLAKYLPNTDILIHGRGPLLEELKSYSSKYNNLTISSDFISRDQLISYYQDGDIFVFPSVDWQPLVVLEAMASGLPLILHKKGGQTESLKEGREALFVKDFNGVKESVESLINNPSQIEKMSKESRKRALTIDWKNIAPLYEKIYK
ncbi:MAG: glycosyltransferase family 4 protein, partial [Candidatus Ranarchaeia archaeon]